MIKMRARTRLALGGLAGALALVPTLWPPPAHAEAAPGPQRDLSQGRRYLRHRDAPAAGGADDDGTGGPAAGSDDRGRRVPIGEDPAELLAVPGDGVRAGRAADSR